MESINRFWGSFLCEFIYCTRNRNWDIFNVFYAILHNITKWIQCLVLHFVVDMAPWCGDEACVGWGRLRLYQTHLTILERCNQTPDYDYIQPYQHALGQRGKVRPALPIMNHTQNQSPAGPVGSSDLNQGPTAFSKSSDCPLQQRKEEETETVTELSIATYYLFDDYHLTSLENEIEKINWDIIGISEMRRPDEKVVQSASQHIMFNKGNDKNKVE